MAFAVLLCACQNSERVVEENESPITTDSLLASKYYKQSYEISNFAPDSAMYYAWRSLGISRKINDEKQIANALAQVAYVYTVQGKNDSAIHYFQLSGEKYLEVGDTNRYLTVRVNQGGQLVENSNYERAFQILSEAKNIGIQKGWGTQIADSYANLGLMEDFKGNIDSSFFYYKNALKHAEKIKDTTRYMRTYNNVGVMFYYAEEYAKAVPYFQKAIVYNRTKKNIGQLSDNYLNLGVSYDLLGKNDSAYHYFILALEAGKQIGNTLIQAKSYQNIGALLLEEGDTLSALENLRQGLALKKEIGENQSLSNSYQYLARIHLSFGDTLRSLIMLNSAMSAAIFVKSKEQIKECYQLYAEYYKNVGNFQKALEYQERKERVKDTLFDIATIAEMHRLDIENYTKEKEETIQRLEGEQEQTWLLLIIIPSVLLICFLLLIKGFKKRQNRLKQEKQQLSSEGKILKSEKQQEVLRNSELIHRVNGQFTVAEWYLNLKSVEAKKEKVDEVISDIRGLLDALSSINKELMNNSGTPLQSSLYNIAEDLKLVANEILHKEIEMQINIPEVRIEDRDMVYLCTLFNELTMNSIKYAFDKEDEPRIAFQIEDLNNGLLRCSYQDNGVGNNPKSKSTGKGLSIIAKIVDNIKGEYIVDTKDGFYFKTTFKKRLKDD